MIQSLTKYFTVIGVSVVTPDGRRWSIEHLEDGGFRLFEISASREPVEHDAVDGQWDASDLIDYLRAIGGRKVGGVA